MSDHATSPLEVTAHADGRGGHELRLVGELDLWGLSAMEEQMERIRSGGTARVRVDLSAVSFIDSSGIRVLLELAAAVDDLTLVNPSRAVARLVELCGLTAILPMTTIRPGTS